MQLLDSSACSHFSSFCTDFFLFSCFLKLSCPVTRKEAELFGLLHVFFFSPTCVSVCFSPSPPHYIRPPLIRELFNKRDPCKLCRHSTTWQPEWVYSQMLSCRDEDIKNFRGIWLVKDRSRQAAAVSLVFQR